ncbi:MAG: hypothetical protein R2857_13020 [Vampirovibrionales bacterium]
MYLQRSGFQKIPVSYGVTGFRLHTGLPRVAGQAGWTGADRFELRFGTQPQAANWAQQVATASLSQSQRPQLDAVTALLVDLVTVPLAGTPAGSEQASAEPPTDAALADRLGMGLVDFESLQAAASRVVHHLTTTAEASPSTSLGILLADGGRDALRALLKANQGIYLNHRQALVDCLSVLQNQNPKGPELNRLAEGLRPLADFYRRCRQPLGPLEAVLKQTKVSASRHALQSLEPNELATLTVFLADRSRLLGKGKAAPQIDDAMLATVVAIEDKLFVAHGAKRAMDLFDGVSGTMFERLIAARIALSSRQRQATEFGTAPPAPLTLDEMAALWACRNQVQVIWPKHPPPEKKPGPVGPLVRPLVRPLVGPLVKRLLRRHPAPVSKNHRPTSRLSLSHPILSILPNTPIRRCQRLRWIHRFQRRKTRRVKIPRIRLSRMKAGMRHRNLAEANPKPITHGGAVKPIRPVAVGPPVQRHRRAASSGWCNRRFWKPRPPSRYRQSRYHQKRQAHNRRLPDPRGPYQRPL